MSRRTARTPIAAAALVAAAAALTLTGCSSSATGNASSPPPAGAASAPTGSGPAASNPAPATSGVTTPGTTAPSGSGPTTAPGSTAPRTTAPAGTGPTVAPTTASLPDTPAGPGACTSAELSVAQTNPNVGAGQYYSTLVFTNTSSRTCTLAGYPGVSYVAAAGQQSGNPATRTGTQYATVTLAPHGTAKATLHDANGAGGYDPGQCQLTPAQGLRIYPPGEKAALFLPWQTQHCAGPSIHALTIGPLTS
ncbi:DUF4232 domain-containing protein [Kitasatospora sp. NBC_01287]|uniref:DUF4232 domain-containing protein n=1 Tax=Kitasatospora sp. NBC_01287 TaxID=2903573 RepID=UPI00225637BF|nr:DUF4232 domain-containing protein [Kitasatospora sp. NBC_01287]MCX4749889.1 DUF4232 domain-containing protein [Kitasatospora sp. NBC_01287]